MSDTYCNINISSRIQREQDFLRASLRESKKLQNLAKNRIQQDVVTTPNGGFVNTAFDRDGGKSFITLAVCSVLKLIIIHSKLCNQSWQILSV